MFETKPDIFDSGNYLSGLSDLSYGISGSGFFALFKDSGLLDEYEERLAIAEYDGGQTPTQAERMAYLDAFVSVLTTLPATDSQKDWLDMRIQTALTWIESQNFSTLN